MVEAGGVFDGERVVVYEGEHVDVADVDVAEGYFEEGWGGGDWLGSGLRGGLSLMLGLGLLL